MAPKLKFKVRVAAMYKDPTPSEEPLMTFPIAPDPIVKDDSDARFVIPLTPALPDNVAVEFVDKVRAPVKVLPPAKVRIPDVPTVKLVAAILLSRVIVVLLEVFRAAILTVSPIAVVKILLAIKFTVPFPDEAPLIAPTKPVPIFKVELSPKVMAPFTAASPLRVVVAFADKTKSPVRVLLVAKVKDAADPLPTVTVAALIELLAVIVAPFEMFKAKIPLFVLLSLLEPIVLLIVLVAFKFTVPLLAKVPSIGDDIVPLPIFKTDPSAIVIASA